MPKQSINTDRVTVVANRLNTINNNINNAFSTMQGKVRQLDNNWNSDAGDAARTVMHKIIKNGDERSKILDNYVALLRQRVNPAYSATETDNIKMGKKLEDSFK